MGRSTRRTWAICFWPQEGRWKLELDELLLMTTGQAPHKEIEDDPGADVRLEMARLAAGEADGVEASDLEVRRMGRPIPT